jgi:hypothetical protein
MRRRIVVIGSALTVAVAAVVISSSLGAFPTALASSTLHSTRTHIVLAVTLAAVGVLCLGDTALIAQNQVLCAEIEQPSCLPLNRRGPRCAPLHIELGFAQRSITEAKHTNSGKCHSQYNVCAGTMQGGGGKRSRERSQGRRDYNSSNGDRGPLGRLRDHSSTVPRRHAASASPVTEVCQFSHECSPF